jgi:nicotinate-nucleotide pyrophosphorylase (carboxylating)
VGATAINEDLRNHIQQSIGYALAEDIGGGDLTASLIAVEAHIHATVITRDAMTMAGRPWFDEVMRQVDAAIEVDWHYDDADPVEAGSELCSIRGPARSILTAERTALNFLQLLSAVATQTQQYVAAIAGTDCRILDTRKTIPGL